MNYVKMLLRDRYYKRKVIGGNLLGNVYDKVKGALSTASKIITLPLRAVKTFLKPIARQALPAVKNEIIKRVRGIASNPKVKKVLADRSRAILSNLISGSGLKRY